MLLIAGYVLSPTMTKTPSISKAELSGSFVLRTKLRMLGSRWACEFVANSQKFTNSFVVGAEVLGQKPDHVRDVEPTARTISSMSAQSLRRLKKALKTARSLHPRKGIFLLAS